MPPPRFHGPPSDLKWGPYNYSVTRTQKETLDGLLYLLSSLPRAYRQERDLWQGGYYSQMHTNGAVILGLNHQSVTVYRTGRLVSNEKN